MILKQGRLECSGQRFIRNVQIRGWRTAHAHDERKQTNSGEFIQKRTNPNSPVFAHFLPIFGQKMGKNGQKTGERKRILAKQGETESFAEFRFGIATPWSTSSTVKVLGGSRSASSVRGLGGDGSTNPVRGLAGYTSADQFGSGYTKGSAGVGSSYKAAPFGHTRPQGHGDTLKPPRQIFTIPVPVQVTVTVVDHLQDCWVWIFWF